MNKYTNVNNIMIHIDEEINQIIIDKNLDIIIKDHKLFFKNLYPLFFAIN
jgi:hypothetical protein